MKKFLKKIGYVVSFILAIIFILFERLEYYLSSKESIFQTNGMFLSLIPGLIGRYVRQAYYSAALKKCELGVTICFGSLISHRDTIIRKGSVIGAYSIIGSCIIENNVLLASRVSILSGKYVHGRFEDTDRELRKDNHKTVKIGKNTWIGEGAIITESVGEDCMIGTGSVVFKEIRDKSLAIGNPARVVKTK